MNDLMTLADIADMHHCSVRHARDVVIRKHGFPSEAPTSTPKNRLWIRSEVRAFVTRRRPAPDGIPTMIPQPA
jgi:hypothetical protein